VVAQIRGGRVYQLFNDNLNEAPYGRGENRSAKYWGDLEVQEDGKALEM